MVVRDIELETYQKIRELLEGDSVWVDTFDEGNRIFYDTVEGTQNPQKSQTADGDYPQARLWIAGGTLAPYAAPTFGTYAPESCGSTQEQSTISLILELKSQTLKMGTLTTLGKESRAALRAGGPRFGLDWVVRWALSWEVKEVDRNEDQETFRWEVRIRIQIGLEYEGGDQTNPPVE